MAIGLSGMDLANADTAVPLSLIGSLGMANAGTVMACTFLHSSLPSGATLSPLAGPNPTAMRLRRVIVREGLWVMELVVDYGGQIYDVALIIELKDGRMWRETRYYAGQFEPPEWRARWVEQMVSEVFVEPERPRRSESPAPAYG